MEVCVTKKPNIMNLQVSHERAFTINFVEFFLHCESSYLTSNHPWTDSEVHLSHFDASNAHAAVAWFLLHVWHFKSDFFCVASFFTASFMSRLTKLQASISLNIKIHAFKIDHEMKCVFCVCEVRKREEFTIQKMSKQWSFSNDFMSRKLGKNFPLMLEH